MSRSTVNPAASSPRVAISAIRVATGGASVIQMAMTMSMTTRREVRAG